jgi:hypothetical protein
MLQFQTEAVNIDSMIQDCIVEMEVNIRRTTQDNTFQMTEANILTLKGELKLQVDITNSS